MSEMCAACGAFLPHPLALCLIRINALLSAEKAKVEKLMAVLNTVLYYETSSTGPFSREGAYLGEVRRALKEAGK